MHEGNELKKKKTLNFTQPSLGKLQTPFIGFKCKASYTMSGFRSSKFLT